MMIVGIDGYCFHRWFGELYPGLERNPGTRMSAVDVVDRAADLGASALSVESFMLDPEGEEVDAVRRRAQARDLQLMWAWGHPGGLGSGARPEALADLRLHVDAAVRAGARVMRICAGGRTTRPAAYAQQREALLPLLAEAAGYAASRDVALAVENHLDLTSTELVDLVETLGSDHLGICLDSANALRLLEDPLEANRRMAPYARACHIKDVTAHRGDPTTFAFWPSVPFGDGLIDMPDLFGALDRAGFDGVLALEIDYLHPRYDEDLDGALRTSLVRMFELAAEVRGVTSAARPPATLPG